MRLAICCAIPVALALGFTGTSNANEATPGVKVVSGSQSVRVANGEEMGESIFPVWELAPKVRTPESLISNRHRALIEPQVPLHIRDQADSETSEKRIVDAAKGLEKASRTFLGMLFEMAIRYALFIAMGAVLLGMISRSIVDRLRTRKNQMRLNRSIIES